jgi:preprotein translocase subunit Sec61beta
MLHLLRGFSLSRQKRRKEEAPMPSTAAGLLRFYEEESVGIKVKPEVIISIAIALILILLLVPIFI